MGSIATEPVSEPFTLKQQWHSQPMHLRVIGAGAGAAGLSLAYKMFHHFKLENADLTIYEKNAGVAGTWYENRYPGCACDIPAHAYTYSFEPNPDWSTFYAYGPEIKGYFERFADKYDLRKYIKLKSRVLSAVWDEEQGIYNVEVEVDGQRVNDWCHVFVNGTGFLNDWKWPKIDGLHSFQGQLLHSADWDNSIDWKGKRVGVIGTGSSAIQIVPQIQKTAAHLVSFMRSVTWISPPVAGDMLEKEQKKFQNDDNEESTTKPAAQYYYTEEDKRNFRENPQAHLEYRQGLEGAANTLFDIFIRDSPASKSVEQLMRTEMHRRIGPGHEELKQKLIPSWPPGCRRITPGDGYLEALVAPNVLPVHHEITKISPTGVLDASGTHHDLDILICATGFNLAFTPRFEVVGRNGRTMRSFFAIPEGPQVYLATAVPNFPNYFVVNGVRGNWASGTAPPSIEICTEYILRCCRKIQTEQLHSLTVRQEPVTQLYEYIDAWHEQSVWNADCKSWYKNNIVGAKLWVYGGSALHFIKTLSGEPKFEHYEIKYRNANMWSFLGNGRTKVEWLKGTEDYVQGKELLGKLSPYIRNADVPFSID